MRSDGAEIICFGGGPDFNLLGGITSHVSGAAAGAEMQTGTPWPLILPARGRCSYTAQKSVGLTRQALAEPWTTGAGGEAGGSTAPSPAARGVARHQATGSRYITPQEELPCSSGVLREIPAPTGTVTLRGTVSHPHHAWLLVGEASLLLFPCTPLTQEQGMQR